MIVSLLITARSLVAPALKSVSAGLRGLSALSAAVSTGMRTHFAGISSAAGTIGTQVAGAAGAAENLTGAMTAGVFQANLLGMALLKVQQAAGFINGKFDEAKGLQLNNIQAATTFSSLAGKTYQEGVDFIESLNNRLAKSAAILPGATQDYKSLAVAIQDNVLEAFKSANGLDMKGFEDSVASLSESFGALGAGGGLHNSLTQLALTNALGGQSTVQLRQLAFFQQNQNILNEIDKRLKVLNKNTLGDLNIKDRVKLLEQVGKKFITEDFKREASMSVDGLMQAFKSTLFDPSTGILGLMRDLRPNEKGTQSAFKAMNEALIELIGENGVFNQVGKLLQAAGVQLLDPMEVLKTGADTLASSLRWVNRTLSFATSFLEFTGSIEETLNQLPSIMGISGITPATLAATLGKGFRSCLAQLELTLGGAGNLVAVVTPYIQSGIYSIGQLIVNAVVDIPSLVAPLVTKGVDRLLSLAPLLVGVLNDTVPVLFFRLGSFLSINLTRLSDFVTPLMNKGIQATVSFLQTLDAYGIGVAVGAAVGQILGVAVDFLTKLDYGNLLVAVGQVALAVVAGISGLIGGLTLGLLPSIGRGLVNIGKGLWDGLAFLFVAIDQTILDGLNLLPGGVSKVFAAGFEALNALLLNGWGGFMAYITNALKAGLDALKQLGESMMAPLRNIPGFANLLPSPPTSSAVGSTAAVPSAAGAMYSGHVPNAAGGLVDAARRESAAMPRNAQVVVANSKEYILQPRGTARVAGGNTYQININGSNHDPHKIAQLVIDAIEQAFTSEAQGQLA